MNATYESLNNPAEPRWFRLDRVMEIIASGAPRLPAGGRGGLSGLGRDLPEHAVAQQDVQVASQGEIRHRHDFLPGDDARFRGQSALQTNRTLDMCYQLEIRGSAARRQATSEASPQSVSILKSEVRCASSGQLPSAPRGDLPYPCRRRSRLARSGCVHRTHSRTGGRTGADGRRPGGGPNLGRYLW